MSRHIHVSLCPPAKGISIALFKVVLYPLVTWHQELSYDSSTLHVSRKCTIRNTHNSSLEPWDQVQAISGPWGRSVCFEVPTHHNIEKGILGDWAGILVPPSGTRILHLLEHSAPKLPRYILFRKLTHSFRLQVPHLWNWIWNHLPRKVTVQIKQDIVSTVSSTR